MPSYHIDLVTILRILSEQSGELHAHVKNIPGLRERCQVHITFTKGKVTSCVIELRGNPLYSGESAFRLLQAMGDLDWDYSPIVQSSPAISALSPSLQPEQPMYERSPVHVRSEESPYHMPGASIMPTDIPQRLRLIERQEFITWHRALRSVYNLIDEKKSIEEIARLLSFPSERTVECISYLLARRAITLQARSQQNSFSPYRLPPGSF